MSDGIVLPTTPSFKNLTGNRFGMLVVLQYAGTVKSHSQWNCQCECGNLVTKPGRHLLSGATRTCGCINAERAGNNFRTHGMRKSAEYRAWAGMLKRCRDKSLANYGGRGIAVCQRWADSFEAFFADMGTRPTPQHSIDRIDNDGNYEPSNCRWATKLEQGLNRRTNRIIEFDGRAMTVSQWESEMGYPTRLIDTRLRRGWTIERAITEPPRKR